MSDLPSAEVRRTVLVIAPDDRRSLLTHPETVDLFENPELAIVEYRPGHPPGSDLAALLRDQNLLRVGTLAIQSPYQLDRYVDANSAIVEFTEERLLKIAQIAQALGAKELNVEEVRQEDRAARGSARLDVKAEFVHGEASAEAEVEQRLRQHNKLRQTFPGSAPNFTTARAILRTSGLAGDPQLLALITMRDSDNPITEHDVHFSGLREAEGSFKVCARVSEGLGRFRIAGLGAEFAAQYKELKDVSLTTVIRF
jgi:hypothetical protein